MQPLRKYSIQREPVNRGTSSDESDIIDSSIDYWSSKSGYNRFSQTDCIKTPRNSVSKGVKNSD